MVLQDRKRLPALRHARVLPLATLFEIDQDREHLLPRRDQVDAALEHEYEVLHLPLASLCVLQMRVQVEAGPAGVIVAEDDLFARLVFFGYVICGVAFDFEFPAPDESGFEAGDCVGFVPFCCAEVAEEAFAGQPEAFAVRERGLTG